VVTPTSFQIRGSTCNLLTLRLVGLEHASFFDDLAKTLALAPGFYKSAPILLDLAPLAKRPAIELSGFCQRLRDLGLRPIGFVGATADWEKAATAAGLPVFPAGRATDANNVPSRKAPLKRPGTRIIASPVRSGQQVYAADGDLVVVSAVSRGAELLADGNIHVYGPLRGRAVAGMGGDTSCRIFCQKLDADLVSIAGIYMVSDQLNPALIGQAVQIRLDGDRLVFEPL